MPHLHDDLHDWILMNLGCLGTFMLDAHEAFLGVMQAQTTPFMAVSLFLHFYQMWQLLGSHSHGSI